MSHLPFCPVCKTEYREGFTRCSDCFHELVERLPPEPPKKAEKRPVYIDDEPAFLASASTAEDCWFIEGGLKNAGIPCLKKDRGMGGYLKIYMGLSRFGADFYVPAKLLSKAQEVLGTVSSQDGNGAPAEELPGSAEEPRPEPDENETERT